MIALHINGKRVELAEPTALLDYLDQLGVDPKSIAVEHNGEIIERAEYSSIVLRDGDRVEIVRMVGGGTTTPLTPHPSPLWGEGAHREGVPE